MLVRNIFRTGLRTLHSTSRSKTILLLIVAIAMSASPLMAKRYGVIIGSNYKGNSSGIPPLDLCERDAQHMEQQLRAAGRFDDVKVLLGQQVTHDNVKNAILSLKGRVTQNDTVALYFSGHGTYSRDSSAPNGVQNLIVMFDRPHISDKEMNEWLSQINTRKLVWIFDCCYAGGIAGKGGRARGAGDIPIDEDQPGKVLENANDRTYFGDKAIVASSDANETSIEIGGSINHGLFTYYFAQGLTKGDLNSDGTITVYEAFHWSKDRVANHAKQFNHNQHPQISGYASGIQIAGKVDPTQPEPVGPEPDPEPNPDVDPDPGPTDVVVEPDEPSDPVGPEEPEVTEHEDRGTVLIMTTILRSMQAGPTPMDPMQLIQRRRRGNADRRVKALLSDNEYPQEVRWLNEAQLRAITGEQVPLGWYVYNNTRYQNQVAFIVVRNVPTGVHEVILEADGYPRIHDRVGVEEVNANPNLFQRLSSNKMFVVASLSGFGSIRGKVFYKNLETPLPNQVIWMPTVKTTNQTH
ncbi:MAG: caspase family protein, partial [Leptospiraceae bacterium]|nr:caspase family protein [Leptospiraceae bacterium]